MLKVVEFPNTSLQDIPAKLRQFAERIEDGTLLDIDAAVLILRDEYGDVLVHGFGNADPALAYWMMGRGMRKLDEPAS